MLETQKKMSGFDNIKVGTIFVNTWTCNADKVSFYQVVKRTPKQVKIRRLKAIVATVETARKRGPAFGRIAPVPGEFVSEPVSKMLKIMEHGNDAAVYLSEGTPGTGSFFVWDGNPVEIQTDGYH